MAKTIELQVGDRKLLCREIEALMAYGELYKARAILFSLMLKQYAGIDVDDLLQVKDKTLLRREIEALQALDTLDREEIEDDETITTA